MEEPAVENGSPPPEESQNRTFIILAIALGGLFIVGLLCLGGYAFFIRPGQQNAVKTQNAIALAANTQAALAQTQAALPTNTPTPDLAGTAQADVLTQAAAASPTPLIAATDTDTPVPTETLPPTATDTAVAVAQVTETPSATLGAAGGGASPTPIGAGGKTGTPTPVGGAKTPTPLVGGLKTATPTAGLPGTGFADQAKVPSLIVLGVVLIAVVVVVRRLRLSLR